MVRSIFRLILLGTLLLALSGMASAAEDVTGFKGFAWGTDFETVNRAKDLEWYRTTDELGKHFGMKDAVYDEQGKVAVVYLYDFYNNKLVVGDVLFVDHSRYLEAVKLLETKYGKSLSMGGGMTYYSFESTMIVCYFDKNTISFFSKKYMDDKIRREDEEKKAKKDKEFDRLFN